MEKQQSAEMKKKCDEYNRAFNFEIECIGLKWKIRQKIREFKLSGKTTPPSKGVRHTSAYINLRNHLIKQIEILEHSIIDLVHYKKDLEISNHNIDRVTLEEYEDSFREIETDLEIFCQLVQDLSKVSFVFEWLKKHF